MDIYVILVGLLLFLLVGLFILITRLSAIKREKKDEFGTGSLGKSFIMMQARVKKADDFLFRVFADLQKEYERTVKRPARIEAIWQNLNTFLEIVEEILADIGLALDEANEALRKTLQEKKQYEDAYVILSEKEPSGVICAQAKLAVDARSTVLTQIQEFVDAAKAWQGKLREKQNFIRAGLAAHEKERDLLLVVNDTITQFRALVYKSEGVGKVNFRDPFADQRKDVLADLGSAQKMMDRVSREFNQGDNDSDKNEGDPILARAEELKKESSSKKDK